MSWLAWWFIFLIFTLPVLYEAWTHLGHRCRRCGNTRISRKDVLDYASRGALPYDLPCNRVHKHKMPSDEWYVQALAPFLLFLALPLLIIMLLVAAVYEVYSNLWARARR